MCAIAYPSAYSSLEDDYRRHRRAMAPVGPIARTQSYTAQNDVVRHPAIAYPSAYNLPQQDCAAGPYGGLDSSRREGGPRGLSERRTAGHADTRRTSLARSGPLQF